MDFHRKCRLGAFSLAVVVICTRSFAHGANELTTNADYENYKVLNYGEPLVLECNTTTQSKENVIKWFKDGKSIQSSGGDRPHIIITENSLTVTRAMEDDVANYTCQLVNIKSNSTISKVELVVVGRPYVKMTETMTVIEGEKLKLECQVIGKPTPTVEWKVGNESYDESKGRVKLSTDPSKGVAINNILELEPAEMSDRGDITCMAVNFATTIKEPNRATCYVRVKDKYAALWPFLGICAEVIVLCTVIFIYEKKRNKAELEESDTDQSPEQKNTPDHGKDSVRQRK